MIPGSEDGFPAFYSEPQSEPLGEAGTRWPEVPGVPCRRCAAALWIWAQGPGCSMLQLQSDVSHPVPSCLLLSLGGFLWQMVEPATLPAFFFEVFPKPVMIEMAFGAFWVTYFLLHGFVRK